MTVESKQAVPCRKEACGNSRAMLQAQPVYRWRWRARLGWRHGQLYHVLCRGRLNSMLIRFADGVLFVTSRNALRLDQGR